MIVGRIEVLSQLKNARFKKACSAGAVRREHRPASRPTGSPHPLSPCADDRWHWRRADFEQRSKSHRRSAPDVGPGRADPCAQSDAASAVTTASATPPRAADWRGRWHKPAKTPPRRPCRLRGRVSRTNNGSFRLWLGQNRIRHLGLSRAEKWQFPVSGSAKNRIRFCIW